MTENHEISLLYPFNEDNRVIIDTVRFVKHEIFDAPWAWCQGVDGVHLTIDPVYNERRCVRRTLFDKKKEQYELIVATKPTVPREYCMQMN